MRRILWLLALALVGIYGSGYFSHGEGGVNRFLAEVEELYMNGDADGLCALMHDEIEVNLEDNTADQPMRVKGGKEEFCAFTRKTAPAMKHVATSMNVTRDDFTVHREWLHPWTADVTYTERRSISIQGLGIQINTVSEDELTLVKTWAGVKIRRLESAAWRND